MAEENVAKTIAAAPVEALPGSERPDYRGRCLYKTGKCMQERALKTSGAAHNLCNEHRSRQNEHQRKLDAKNRITKKERRSSAGSAAATADSAGTGADATATATSRTRSPRYAPYPASAAATVTAKRRALPVSSVASALMGAKDEAEAVASPEMPISSASASASAAVTAASIVHLAPSAGVTRSVLQGLATSTAATSVVAAGNGNSRGMLYLPNGPQPPQLSYPCVMQDFDGIVVPLPSYLEGQERIEFRSRIYQKVLDFISEECILRFGAKVETAASVASRPVAAAVLAAVDAQVNAQSTTEPEPQPQAAASDRLQSKSASDANASDDTRATPSSKKPRAAAGPTANI